MKKRIVALFFAALMIVGLSACGKKNDEAEEAFLASQSAEEATAAPEIEEKEPDASEIYQYILRDYYNTVKNPDSADEFEEGKMGVVENARYLEGEALNEIGYIIYDVNGDGVEELLIGMGNQEWSYTKNTLLAVYTIKNNEPVFVLEGRSRDSYFLMKNGEFLNSGSNGAAYKIFGVYSLENAELVCKDFYFSYEKNNDFEDIGFFHNTTGIYEKSASEELDITDDEFWAIEEKLSESTAELDFIPFSKFTSSTSSSAEGA